MLSTSLLDQYIVHASVQYRDHAQAAGDKYDCGVLVLFIMLFSIWHMRAFVHSISANGIITAMLRSAGGNALGTFLRIDLAVEPSLFSKFSALYGIILPNIPLGFLTSAYF